MEGLAGLRAVAKARLLHNLVAIAGMVRLEGQLMPELPGFVAATRCSNCVLRVDNAGDPMIKVANSC